MRCSFSFLVAILVLSSSLLALPVPPVGAQGGSLPPTYSWYYEYNPELLERFDELTPADIAACEAARMGMGCVVEVIRLDINYPTQNINLLFQ